MKLRSLILCAGLLGALALTSRAESAGGGRSGVSYQHDTLPEGPWSIHVAKLALTNTDYRLVTTLGQGTIVNLSTLTEQVKSLPARFGKPIAAVNGDFYHIDPGLYQGDPYGLQIIDGELVSAPCERSCFWLDAQNRPHMTNVTSRLHVVWPGGRTTPFGLNEQRTNGGVVLYSAILGISTRAKGGRELILEREGNEPWLPLQANQTVRARVREVNTSGDSPLDGETLVLSISPQALSSVPTVKPGDVLSLVTDTSPHLGGARVAIGGGPALVRQGKAMTWRPPQLRQPRTAIGWNAHSFFLVEVDGRQRGLSVGMSFPELADYFVKLGCTEALNLDGGGSASFWFMGQTMSSPSLGAERGVGNALVIVRNPSAAPPSEAPAPAPTPSGID